MNGYIRDDLVEEIRLSNDIVDVVSSYVKLERKGKYMFGICPFHREKTASFSVTQSKQIYYCYSCGRGGDVINFIKNIENLDFREAVEFLANRAKIEIPDNVSYIDEKLGSLKKGVKEISVYAARFFYNNLVSEEGKNAREYLKKRGILNSTIKKFGLGYSSNEWDKLYCGVKNKFDKEVIEKCGLFLKKKNGEFYDRFRGRVMFPIFDVRGEVVAFGGRTMGDDVPKYLNSPETVIYSKRKNLYAMNFAKRYSEDNLIAVEGYMDVVSLHQAGVQNVVASLGTAFTEEQARLMKKYTKEIVLSYDMDDAGRNATLRAISILEDLKLGVKVLNIPKGKDPDEFIKKYGKDVFCELINNAITAFEYRIGMLEKSINFNSLDGKVKFLNEVAKILSGVYNSLEREVYIDKIVDDYKISKESILREIDKLNKKNILDDTKKEYRINNNGKKLIKKSDDILSYYEELILVLLANDNELFWSVEKYLKEIKFEDETTSNLLDIFIKKIKSGDNVVFSQLISMLDDDSSSKYVRIYECDCNFENNEKAILDIIKKMRIIKLQKRQQDIVKKLSSGIFPNDNFVLKLRQELGEVLEEMKMLKK